MEPTQIPKASERRERSRAFGSRFREVREAAGTSVQALAQATRISASFIEALEAGAFDKLPGEVFGRGFVRSICKALNLDAVEMIAAFDECWDHTGPGKPVLEVEIKDKPFQPGAFVGAAQDIAGRLRLSRSFGRIAAVVVAITVLGVGGWQLSRLDLWKSMRKSPSQVAAPQIPASQTTEQAALQPSSPLASAVEKPAEQRVAGGNADEIGGAKGTPAAGVPVRPAARAVPAVPAAPAVAAEQSTPKSDSDATAKVDGTTPAVANLALKSEGGGDQLLDLVVSEPVRVRADVDGEGPQTKDYAPGSYRIQFKDKVEMMIYDASAMKISFNGRPLGPLGNKGRVRRISFQSVPLPTKKL